MIGKKRVWVVWLLLLSCMAAIVLLWKVDAPSGARLTSASQLDSLITDTLHDHHIAENRVRVRTVEIDSLFSRNIYTVRVPSDFSKTSFHYSLNQKLQSYQAGTIGHVQFPERNLRIHLLVNETVHRTIFLNSE